ncbi:MAG: hypothetical protein HY665_08225, partial [Chloroflexi bacterium]|nr:hypothetical protein [Chloroflexota bacterium]
MKRVFLAMFVVLSALLVALPSLACSKTTSSGQTTIIPEGANFVLDVKLDQLTGDTDIADAYKAAAKDYPGTPATLDAAIGEITNDSGVNLRDFSRVLLFFNSGEPGQSGFGDSGAAIITGNFQQDKFVTDIGKSMNETLTPTDYNGFTIYTSEGQEDGLSFLGDQQAVIGTMQTVKDVIDVKRGDKPALNSQMAETYSNLGDSLIRLVISLPPDLMERAQKGLPPELPSSIADLLDINVLGVGIVKEGNSFIIQFKLLYPSDSAAASASNAFKALKLVAPGLSENVWQEPADPGSIAVLIPFLDKASASTKGSFLN